MKIVKLTAENVKRLRAVEIEPDGHTVVISGRNAQGKSSVLDSIWYALGGAKVGAARPIRDGEDHASVAVEIAGDDGPTLHVTRTWAEGGASALRVESPEGATYRGPQAMLDALVGRLSFDPLGFAEQSEADQRRTLLGLIDLPFDLPELDAQRAALYEQRTAVGRDVRRLQGAFAELPEPADDVPAEPVDIAALVERHSAARAAHAEVGTVARRIEGLDAGIARRDEAIADLVQRLGTLRRERDEAQAARDEWADRIEAMRSELPDIAAIDAALAAAEGTNDAVRAREHRAGVRAELDDAEARRQTLSEQLTAIDKRKADAVAAAQMPVDGLGFDDGGVTYQGVPFAQCSSAEQLRISLAMAVALNPRLRVVLIRDGSLLDSQNMAVIADMAERHDCQVWIERVDESGEVGIVIEDGAVKA